MLGSSPTTEVAALRELVRTYDIRWEAGYERAVVDGQLRTIGLTLDLTAIHPPSHEAPMPGCPQCKPVANALRRVAEAVLPKEHRRSFYEVSVASGHHVLTRSGSPEMTATITILHEQGINDPVDACEERCRSEMIAKLEDLGARRA